MLARRITSILPNLSFEEALEITKIHSVAGKVGNNSIINGRPFRSPHHTISTAGLIGGGSFPKPRRNKFVTFWSAFSGRVARI